MLLRGATHLPPTSQTTVRGDSSSSYLTASRRDIRLELPFRLPPSRGSPTSASPIGQRSADTRRRRSAGARRR
eukprot:8482030-Heterocapsa_arctica.AAC.1